MIFKSETELVSYAEKMGRNLKLPAVFELIGDVGAGKTTFARALAKGLGVKEPVTSPSFSISKRYAFPGGTLIHYDFYRLDEPGIMSSELEEALEVPNSVVVIEWGDSIRNLLPETAQTIYFKTLEDDSRELSFGQNRTKPERISSADKISDDHPKRGKK